jgi:NAD(P)-dependent dehydrogenase (short-subunit alcohol dehydrogenase family)
MTDQPRKTAVVTGGNSGIGYETARALAQRGWRIVVTGRNAAALERAAAAIAAETGAPVAARRGDFTSLASVRALAGELSGEERIDVLVNNVGIALSKRRVTDDGNETMLQVNHLAPFLLTNLLLDKLRASAPARIVNVSSRAHYRATGHGFEDFQFARAYDVGTAYARTKLYNVLFTRELARRLAGTGVTANALHPGTIATNIGRDGDLAGIHALAWRLIVRFRSRPLADGSHVPVFVATDPQFETASGHYVGADLRATEPSPLARDDAAARRLWEMSAALTGVLMPR